MVKSETELEYGPKYGLEIKVNSKWTQYGSKDDFFQSNDLAKMTCKGKHYDSPQITIV